MTAIAAFTRRVGPSEAFVNPARENIGKRIQHQCPTVQRARKTQYLAFCICSLSCFATFPTPSNNFIARCGTSSARSRFTRLCYTAPALQRYDHFVPESLTRGYTPRTTWPRSSREHLALRAITQRQNKDQVNQGSSTEVHSKQAIHFEAVFTSEPARSAFTLNGS